MICSRCGSTEFYKNGHKPDGRQRWQCKVCGREHVETRSSDLNSGETYFYSGLSRTREGSCGSPLTSGLDGETQEREMAYLETAKTDLLKDFPTDLQGEILRFIAYRENKGFKSTRRVVNTLSLLTRLGAELRDPESVKKTIKNMSVSDSTKKVYCDYYESFLRFLGGSWERPNYRVEPRAIYIPTEAELDLLIAGLGRKVGTFCQVLKDTGASASEGAGIIWRDIDFERRLININKTTKGHSSRTVQVSQKCLDMLNRLARREEKIFHLASTVSSFYIQRKRLAHRLSNPNLLKIHLHTFRHWKGTTTYHRKPDIEYVQKLLGHKNIENTMIYINLDRTYFGDRADDFTVKVASTVEEAVKLIEVGFEYVTEMNGVKIFRQRK